MLQTVDDYRPNRYEQAYFTACLVSIAQLSNQAISNQSVIYDSSQASVFVVLVIRHIRYRRVNYRCATGYNMNYEAMEVRWKAWLTQWMGLHSRMHVLIQPNYRPKGLYVLSNIQNKCLPTT